MCPSNDGPGLLITEALITGVVTLQVTFTGPVTAGDFDPAWMFDDDESTGALSVAQVSPNVLEFTYGVLLTDGSPWTLTDAPAGVVAPQTGVYTS